MSSQQRESGQGICSLAGQYSGRVLLDTLHLGHDDTCFFSLAIDMEHFGRKAAGRDCRIQNMVQVD
jgi:hypothetical protein